MRLSDLLTGIQAVLFDFDGLILDSEWAAFVAWSKVYEGYGQKLELNDYIQCVGSGYHRFHPVKHLEKLIAKSLDENELIKQKNKLKDQSCQMLEPMPGVLDLLQKLAVIPTIQTAIVSSSHRPWVSSHVQRMKIENYFKTLITGDRVKHIKPAPDLYLLAAKELNVQPEFCLVFEDSENGIIAAKDAGMNAIAVPNRITQGSNFDRADGVLNNFSIIEFL